MFLVSVHAAIGTTAVVGHCPSRSTQRHIQPYGAAGSGSPAFRCSVLPDREPNTFSNS